KTKIMLTGISMGAATVMTVADKDLPENVVGILADCGYTSPKEIIQKVIKDLKLPPKATYPFIYLGARWFGHLDLHSDSPLQAVKNAKVPILFIHGDTDAFVPFEMSRQLYETCGGQKYLCAINGAGHGLAYPVNPQQYFDVLSEFSAQCGIPVNQ
ncbi:MAG: alpha/beta hydrolase, partial [Clostridia bacterium]|nr:alpha/beta hydrolase [Clostridia bacterium]